METKERELKIGSKNDMLANSSFINGGNFYMGNNINQVIEQIINLYDNGGNPNAMMQKMVQQTPQINQMQTKLQNMSQGRSPSEFLLQLARQNGVSEKNLEGLTRILSGK